VIDDTIPTGNAPVPRRRNSIFTTGPAEVLDHTRFEIDLPRELKHGLEHIGTRQDNLTRRGRKLGIDATKVLPSEGFKRPRPLLIKIDEAVSNKFNSLFGNAGDKK